ncbi:serine-rich adhesin for platelets-like isoform X2 [Palaemon carinicauda]|uniref:serine-rich adhesin for platelets-like isoform X2 n=1 Tax=Palaemon carinicauda TaxID=392227 RepID=UPI0035B688CF
MEERLNQMNAVLQSMQKTLECNICLDMLNKPLTTKCGHSFCTDCIHQVVKNSRNAAQCPLCLCHVTRRSLGHNRKITGLVAAVRDIIASIKKDCCFEVTPSKYRPKRQPVLPYEEDDSENEENDEPRRGMRKRAVTTHYNAEVHVPKPRGKPAAKQRILASSGGEELNLYVDGKTEMTAVNTASLHEESSIHSYITQEHSYSSPTKQEPHERSGQGKGSQLKGKVASSTRGKSKSLALKSGKDLTKPIHTYMKKHEDDHISLSQQIENKIEFNDVVLSGGESTSVLLGSKIDHETSADKVEKWLNNSSEVGFRIGLKESSDSTSVLNSEGSKSFHISDEQKAVKPQASTSSLKASDCASSSDSKEIKVKALCDGNFDTSKSISESGHTSAPSNVPKFFKSKTSKDVVKDVKDSSKNDIQKTIEDDVATVIFGTSSQIKGTPDDPYKFIPSQKTPKQKIEPKRGRGARSRARGSLPVSRGRLRVRGQGTRASAHGVKDDRRDSVADFGLLSSKVSHVQSTPAVKGKSSVEELDISMINKSDISVNQKGPSESNIVYRRDDDDDDDDFYGIPDSCPVNTKDEFDEMVCDVKEKTLSIREENNSIKPMNDEEEENLLFVTPAQAVENSEANDGVLPKVDNAECLDESAWVRENTKRNKSKTVESKKTVTENKTSKLSKPKKGSSDSESKLPKLKKGSSDSRSKLSKLKKGSSGSESDTQSNSSKSSVSQRMSKAEKAKEEIEAIKALFDEVDDHQLSTVSIEEDEKKKKVTDKVKDNTLRQNISWHNQTLENTQLNKTIASLDGKPNVSMPPPKAPLRNRKVKFLPDLSKTLPISSVSENKEQSATSKCVAPSTAKTSRGRGSSKAPLRTNVRYGSEAKHKILEPNKIQAVSINIKDTKSPGWSHVTGARKDLKTRHTSLNITGGEQRNEIDAKVESGMHNHTSYIPSSSETNMMIDDQTQDNDVEHLQSSQSKVELVKKLKSIVQKLKEVEGGSEVLPKLCEEEDIPESVKEQVLGQQHDVDKEENINNITEERVNKQESQVTEIMPCCPTETEPFECSDLPVDPPVVASSSSNTSASSRQQRKRKADDVSPEDIQSTQEKKPSKLARKTFSLGAKRENNSDLEKHGKTAKNGALVSAKVLSKLPFKETEMIAPKSPLSLSLKKTEMIAPKSPLSLSLKKTEMIAPKSPLSLSFKETEMIAPKSPLSVENLDHKKREILGTESEHSVSPKTSFNEPATSVSSTSTELHSSPAVITSELQPPSAVNTSSIMQPSSIYPDTFPEKPRLPHHTLSPSMVSASRTGLSEETMMSCASTSTGSIQNVTSRVIPFRCVGSLCSERCKSASEEGAKIDTSGSLVRDLCLHSVPCEVYQVLMKYMNILSAEKEQHSKCCCGKPNKLSEDKANIIEDKPNLIADEKPSLIPEEKPSLIPEEKPRPIPEKPNTIAEEKPNTTSEESFPLGPQELPNLCSNEKQDLPSQKYTNENVDKENNLDRTVTLAFDSEVPNSCDTEELELAIPIPFTGVATRSSRDRGRNNVIKEHFVKKREKKEPNAKKEGSSFSSDSQMLKTDGIRTKNFSGNRVGKSDSLVSQPTPKIVNYCKENEFGCKETSQNEKDVLNQCEVEGEQSEETSEHTQKRGLNNTYTTETNSSSNNKTVRLNNSHTTEISSSSNNKTFILSSNPKLSSQDDVDLSEDVVPSSCEIGSSQQSESLLTSTDLSNIKFNQASKIEEKFQKQNPKNKEKVALLKMNSDAVDIEKENFKNRSSLQLAVNRPKRRPLQSGPPDLQNIMSQGVRDAKNLVSDKIEASQLRQFTQASSKLLSQRPSSTKNLVLSDVNTSGRATRGNALLGNKGSNTSEESGSTLEDDNNSTQRKFKRIRMPSSSSSSEDSDSENITQKRKRKPKVSSDSESSLTSKVAKIENKGEKHEGQHILDSEEMEVMERFDKNIWEYFGHPDMDLMETQKGKESPLTIEDGSQQDKDVEVIPSDEDIPNTDDVMRNVEADLALIKKIRQKKEDSQMTVDLSSQVSDSSLKLPSLSMNTKSLMKRADKNLSVAENMLDYEDDMFQDFVTPTVERKRNVSEKATSDVTEKSASDVTEKSTSDVTEKSSKSASTSTLTKDSGPQVIGESDDDSEGDLDNVSHSSAHSSQSEAISTQKHKQVQSEVELLKARVRELEAEMKKKSDVKQSIEAEMKNKSDVKQSMEAEMKNKSDVKQNTVSDTDSKESEKPVNSKENKENKSHDSEDELFASLPDFNASNRTIFNPLTSKPHSSTRPNEKPASAPVQEACHVVCTGLNSSEMLKVDEFIKRIAVDGSSLKKSWTSTVTHVVVKTDKDMLAQRTLKYLYGVAAGCWVLSLQWVFDSLSLNKSLPEVDYEVLDCTGIPGPRRSRTYFKPIFENYEFYLKPPFHEVSVDQLKDLLELCGARILKSPTEFSQNKNIMKLIIVQTDTKHDFQSYLTKYQKITLGHDWIIECVGMHSHVCISPFVMGTPNKRQYAASGIPAALLEESQELTCSQVP